MKVLLSPAKSLNLTSTLPVDHNTQSCFREEAKFINSILKQKTPSELAELMNISSTIAELNYERNQSWTLPFTKKNSRPAVYAFSGDVYKGLDPYSIDAKNIDFLQSSVRIISCLYGLLKPLDLIQPYRLEMGTKMPIAENRNLYEYWRIKITKELMSDLKLSEPIINLASNEYFKAIDKKVLKNELFNVEFKELKDGNLKTIAIYSKKARGLMTRFIVDNRITSIDKIKEFNLDNYIFSESYSSKYNFVFFR